ncbi:outer membrane protein transport protein [Dokdonella sp.]|uniref:OmpP1/FadL family transporter n=1 Tax=Dokdonella sp. TaxID=2291710 RepID=UPI00261450EA|nr:outer membrane protein transport protein [Dokdonella sp.]
MQRISRRPRLAPALATLPLALAAAFAGQEAQASAFQLKENSVQGLGKAFAGETAAPGDCAVVVNNPAAMSEFGDGNCVQADLNVIQFETRFKGTGAYPALTATGPDPIGGGDGGNGGVVKPVPAMFFAHRVNSDLVLGASVYAPFGFETSYKDGWVGRYEALKSKLESIDLAFSASYRLTDSFSIGGAIYAQRTSAELTQAIDLGTVLAGPTGGALMPGEADGFGGLKGDDWGWGFGLGALWKPTESDRIGFNFHSQIDHTISGDGKFLVPSNLRPLLGNAFTDSPGNADFNTPWFANASWWHTVNDQLSIGANIGFTHWSSFKELVVKYDNPSQPNSVSEFNWDNSWFYSIGGEYRLDDRWTLRAGLAYDETPTIDATRTPRVPDANRTWGSLGVGYKINDQLRIDASFLHIWVDDGKVDHQTATFDTLTGKFASKGNVFSVAGQYRF